MKKVGDGLPPFELENGAMCVFKCVLQRPKEVVLQEFMRMVMGDRVDCSRKTRGTRGRVGRTKGGLEREVRALVI